MGHDYSLADDSAAYGNVNIVDGHAYTLRHGGDDDDDTSLSEDITEGMSTEISETSADSDERFAQQYDSEAARVQAQLQGGNNPRVLHLSHAGALRYRTPSHFTDSE